MIWICYQILPRLFTLFPEIRLVGPRPLANSISNSGRIRMRRFWQKEPQKDGHLITEDSVLPTTAPGGAPERNRCYQTPAYLFVLPLAASVPAPPAVLPPSPAS